MRLHLRILIRLSFAFAFENFDLSFLGCILVFVFELGSYVSRFALHKAVASKPYPIAYRAVNRAKSGIKRTKFNYRVHGFIIILLVVLAITAKMWY